VSAGVFRVDAVDVVGNKRSAVTATVDVQILSEGFSNMSLKSACSTDNFFLGKSQNFQFWDNSAQVPVYQDF